MYKLGSLFDGSGTCPLAASLCGMNPVWASEIEPYPIAVTASRFPNMKHLGSVTGVRGVPVRLRSLPGVRPLPRERQVHAGRAVVGSVQALLCDLGGGLVHLALRHSGCGVRLSD